MSKYIVYRLMKPHGYHKHIYVTYDDVLIGDFINITNGYYDEPHKVVSIGSEIIAEKEYQKAELVGYATGHKTAMYIAK